MNKAFCCYLVLMMNRLNNNREGLLGEACGLHRKLMEISDKKKQREVIGRAWVRILIIVAVKCRITSHVEELATGGEFLSLVWLLVLYMIAPQILNKEI